MIMDPKRADQSDHPQHANKGTKKGPNRVIYHLKVTRAEAGIGPNGAKPVLKRAKINRADGYNYVDVILPVFHTFTKRTQNEEKL